MRVSTTCHWIKLLCVSFSAQSMMFCGLVQAQPGVEDFKAFLQDPPTLHKIVAEVCAVDNTTTNSGLGCFYVLIRYQTNGFFYREVPRLGDLYTTNVFPGFRCAGRYGDEFWNFGIDGLVLDYSTNRQESLVKTLDHVLIKASKVLNLGVFDLFPRSITWTGYSIIPITNRAGVQIQGGLIFGEGQQLPTGLRLITDYQGYRVPWELKYEYAKTKSVPQFLPTKIVGESIRDGGRSFQFEIHILEVALGSNLLSKDFFKPNSLLGRVPYQVLSTDDGKFSQDKLNRTLKPLSTSDPKPPEARGWVRAIFVLSLLLLFPLFYFKNRREARKPT